jgi:HD-like signal output (HDOD) protein
MTLSALDSSDSATLNVGGVVSDAAFRFITELAQELSGGKIELPSFPDVAIRVRKVLMDEDVGPEKIARVVLSEPGLVARILALANSAALNRSGKTITDAKTAVNRIGHNNVRTAAVSFAIGQLRNAAALKHIERELEGVWKEATLVAALSHSVAQRTQAAISDEALLAGLLHNVGKIYILARANRHGNLLQDPPARNEVIRGWHANIGKAIVENWGFPQQISDAVAEHEDIDRRHVSSADLTDVLTVASMMAPFVDRNDLDQSADFDLNMQGVHAYGRLGLDNEKCTGILMGCKEEIRALRTALGD